MHVLNEVCERCGLTYGSHHSGSGKYPYNYCPGHEGKMDWDKGPGTVFEASGEYKEDLIICDFCHYGGECDGLRYDECEEAGEPKPDAWWEAWED